MKPRKPITRSRKPIPRRVRPRSKSGRRFKYAAHNAKKIEWMRTEVCVIGEFAPFQWKDCFRNGLGPDPHHEPPRSRGGDDTQIVALCGVHHAERHALGKRVFEAKYGVDLDALVVETEARWQAYQAGAAW